MGKQIFFDIDGTLYSHKTGIQKSTKELLNKLKEKGHKVYVASGRVNSAITKEISDLGFDGYVLSDGAQIEINGEMIFETKMEKEKVKKILEYARKNHMLLAVYGKKNIYVDDYREELANIFRKEGASLLKVTKFGIDPLDESIEPIKFFVYSVKNDTEKHKKELEEFGNVIYYNMENYDAFDISPEGCTKAKGVEKLLEQLNLDVKDTIALGDGDNDIDLFKFVNTSVAMKKSTKGLLEVATHITDDIEEEGLYKAFEILKLI